MKFVTFALALIGATSAAYLPPALNGNPALVCGHGTPAFSSYNAQKFPEKSFSNPDYAAQVYSTQAYAKTGYATPTYSAAAYVAGKGYANPGYAAQLYSTPGYATPAYATQGFASPAISQYVKKIYGNPITDGFALAAPEYAAQPFIVKKVVSAPEYAAQPFIVKKVVSAPGAPAFGFGGPVNKKVFAGPVSLTGHSSLDSGFYGSAVKSYSAGHIDSSYAALGTQPNFGNKWGGNGWGAELWKKQKAAAH